MAKHPNRNECYEILKEYGTPVHVIGHCKAVAAVAYRLGKALNQSREMQLDLDLILAAGLLHDMARTEEEHGQVAADWCLEHGYAEEADIIKVHMYYDLPAEETPITEIDLVCLGDRLSKEDRYVGLDERMEYVIAKAERAGKVNARAIILEKKAVARRLMDRIEDIIGVSIDHLMTGIDYESIEQW